MVVIDDAHRQAELEATRLKDTQNVIMTKEQIVERAVEIRLERLHRK